MKAENNNNRATWKEERRRRGLERMRRRRMKWLKNAIKKETKQPNRIEILMSRIIAQIKHTEQHWITPHETHRRDNTMCIHFNSWQEKPNSKYSQSHRQLKRNMRQSEMIKLLHWYLKRSFKNSESTKKQTFQTLICHEELKNTCGIYREKITWCTEKHLVDDCKYLSQIKMSTIPK